MSFVQRLRSLSGRGQIVLAVLAGLVLLVVLISAYFIMRPTYEVLFRDLRPADAATIVAQLDQESIPYRLDDGGATILVPSDALDQTRLSIMGADLPLKGTVGFELFNKSDMGLTEFAQRINYQRALQGELSRTIMTIDAIETARVHLTLPEPSIFRADRQAAKASVTLTTRPGRSLETDTVAGIQRLVSASVADLDPTAVVVINAQGVPVAGASSPRAEASPSSIVQQTRAIEQYYGAAILTELAPLYPGVTVEVLLPLDQWGSPDTLSADREAAVRGWSPMDRSFRLTVRVSSPTPFTPSQQDDIARLVQNASGWSVERGDALLFPPWSPSTDEAASPTAPTVASLPPPTTLEEAPASSENRFALIVSLGLAAVTLPLLALVLLRRRRSGARLSDQQRMEFARRLKTLLAEEAGRAD